MAYLLFGSAAGLLAGTVSVTVRLLIIFALAVGMSTLAMVRKVLVVMAMVVTGQ